MIVVNPEEFRANCVTKMNTIFEDEKISKNIEQGIFNYSVKQAKERKIIRKWENKYFVQIYFDRFRTIFLNLSDDSYVGNTILHSPSVSQFCFTYVLTLFELFTVSVVGSEVLDGSVFSLLSFISLIV